MSSRSPLRILRSQGPLLATAAIVILAAVLYVFHRGISFDDGDSISFALALRDFDLVKQQPQPPGFPLYVALGRLLAIARPDALSALTTLSAISAGLAVGATFLLGYLISGRYYVGALAAPLLAFAPVFWLSGEKALSDVPAIAACLWAIVGLCAFGKGSRLAVVAVAPLFAGLSLGFRPQNLLAVAPFAAYRLWESRGNRKELILSAGGGALGLLMWVAPVAAASGGLGKYVDLAREQSRHVLETDSIFALGPLSAATLRFRASAFFDTLASELAGVTLPQPISVAALAGLALLLLLLLLGLAVISWRQVKARLVLLWLLLAMGQNFVYESLDRPRLMLLFVPALVLLAALALSRLRPTASLLCAGAMAVWLFAYTYPLAAVLSSQPSPAAQATGYVRQSFNPADTVLAAAGSFRHLQYSLPEFKTYYLYAFDRKSMQSDVSSKRYGHVVIFDRDEFQSVQDVLSEGKDYLITADTDFARHPLVHREHSHVRVVALTRADLLATDELALPPGGVLQLGANNDQKHLGSGWYRREEIGGVAGRWAGGSSSAQIRLSLDSADYQLRFFATAFPPNQALTVLVDGSPLPAIELRQDWAEYQLMIPRSLLSKPVTELSFQHSALRSAFEATQGASSDQRPLAAAYSWLALTRQ